MDKILSTLGMARKAGKTVAGEASVEKAVKEGKAFLVIVAGDASENTKKLFRDKCAWYHVPNVIYSDKESLGHAMGLQFRSSAAVLDEGFAGSILSKLTDKKIGG